MVVRWNVRDPFKAALLDKGIVVCAGGKGSRLTAMTAIKELMRTMERSGDYRSVSIEIRPKRRRRA